MVSALKLLYLRLSKGYDENHTRGTLLQSQSWEALLCSLVTPHAQREWGKVIGCGVHMFVNEKIFESYFRNRLIFSNIRSRTSRRIYRLGLPLRAPETLSSLSKSRFSIFNTHLTLFVRRMTSHNSIGKYRHLV